MSLEFEQHAGSLTSLAPAAVEVVRASWSQACKAFGDAGIEVYLAGIRALGSADAAAGPFTAFVRAAPDIAEEAGHQSVSRLLGLLQSLRGDVEPGLLELVVTTSAVAARRLGDPQLFSAYLQLAGECARLDPTALSLLLARLDLLLGRLTVAGLRRWVIRGLRAYPDDLEGRWAYFRLENDEAVVALRAESEGTLFAVAQRQLDLYLRALAVQPVRLRASAGRNQLDQEPRPFLEPRTLHVPDAFPPTGGVTGDEVYRAALAHALAHLRFSPPRQAVGRLKPMAIVVISLIEDARVEQLLIREYPGLQQLWSRLHTAVPSGELGFDALTRRLARALIDPSYEDDNYWVNKGRSLFQQNLAKLEDYAAFRQIASVLGNDLGQMRVRFDPKTYVVEPRYRDDNRFLWEFSSEDTEQIQQEHGEVESVRPETGPGGAELDLGQVEESASPDREQERKALIPVTPEAESISAPVKYPEWDYLIAAERPAWCTVIEKRPPHAPLESVAAILERHHALVDQIRGMVRAVQLQKPLKRRRQQDGDDIDLDAAIGALISIRSRQTPDQRVHVRVGRRVRDLAVLVLLDLSESTNDRVAGTFTSVLDLSREATVLLADAMSQIGDAFAIHGFASNGRHEVEYYRLKDFDRPYDDHAKERLAGMRGQLSTRMGAAIRHAGQFLRYRRSARKLVLLITDGEPSDVDVRDARYLRADTKKAVDALAKYGVHTFCMTLDPKADEYVKQIFGERNYMVVDHISRLPERLPMLYMRVTHG
jgi:nitric oxide reductase activation protein